MQLGRHRGPTFSLCRSGEVELGTEMLKKRATATEAAWTLYSVPVSVSCVCVDRLMCHKAIQTVQACLFPTTVSGLPGP